MEWIENGASEVAFHCSDEKKNVYLIGDSIRRGYCATVKEKLSIIKTPFYILCLFVLSIV